MRQMWVWVFVFSLGACGCGNHELGAKAPAFGSSTKVSTTAGFLEGRWESKLDDSKARYKPPLGLGMLKSTMTFRKDHTCDYDVFGHVAHMKWESSGDGIDLTVTDVDGIDPAKVKVDGDRATAYDRHDPRYMIHRPELIRNEALSIAKATDRLELMSDQKRMFTPGRTREDGSSF